MQISELVLIALLALGGLMGFKKGLISQVTMFVGLLIGTWLAIHFATLVGVRITTQFQLQSDNAYLVAFILIFAAVVVGVYFLGKFAKRILKILFLGWVDKLAGLLLGVLKTALLVSVILTVFQRTGLNDKFFSHEQQEAIFFRTISEFAPTVYPSLQELGHTVLQQLDTKNTNQ